MPFEDHLKNCLTSKKKQSTKLDRNKKTGTGKSWSVDVSKKNYHCLLLLALFKLLEAAIIIKRKEDFAEMFNKETNTRTGAKI